MKKNIHTNAALFFCFLFLIMFQQVEPMEPMCSGENFRVLNKAIERKDVSLLFFSKLDKLYSEKAILEQSINNNQLNDWNNLLDCSHNYLNDHKESAINLEVKEIIENISLVNTLLSKMYTSKDFARLIGPSRNNIINFNKQAYVDIMIYEPIHPKLTGTYDEFFKKGKFAVFFETYHKLIEDKKQKITFDDNGNLSGSSYGIIASFALLPFLGSKAINELSGEERYTIAIKAFESLRLLKSYLMNEIDKLTIKKSSFWTINKSSIQKKINDLVAYRESLNQILEALLINDLYKKLPPMFYTRMKHASPVNSIVFGETEAFILLINRLELLEPLEYAKSKK